MVIVVQTTHREILTKIAVSILYISVSSLCYFVVVNFLLLLPYLQRYISHNYSTLDPVHIHININTTVVCIVCLDRKLNIQNRNQFDFSFACIGVCVSQYDVAFCFCILTSFSRG